MYISSIHLSNPSQEAKVMDNVELKMNSFTNEFEFSNVDNFSYIKRVDFNLVCPQ